MTPRSAGPWQWGALRRAELPGAAMPRRALSLGRAWSPSPEMSLHRLNAAFARGVARVGLAFAVLGSAAAAQPAEPPRQAFLRIEAAAHVAPIARLAVDAEGRLLATVSDDKTLRLWSLPDGAPRGVLRPPIGPQAEGELYAVALSPDGRRVFAAGYTAASWERSFAIYVFDTTSLRMLARLPGLPAPVQHLAISPDGTRLAAALGGRAGIRVWDARSGQPLWDDAAFNAPARMVAFAPGEAGAEKLAASGADGRVRIYDRHGRKLADRAPVTGARPFGLAWSPDGALLALGFEDRLRVEILAGGDLRTVFTPDVAGLAGEGLLAVAWAADARGGVQLHAAGDARRAPPTAARGVVPGARGVEVAAPRGLNAPATAPRDFVIRRWADFGLGPATDIPAARETIAHLIALPGGGLAYAAADPGWGRLAPDGSLALAPRPPGGDFRAAGQGLAVSADGTRLRFTLRPGEPALQFDAQAGLLARADATSEGFATARVTSARLQVADWRNGNRPRLGQALLRLGEGEYARSLALLPEDRGILLGTDTHLRLFDSAGAPLAALAVPSAAWGLALAQDRAVAALGDGTIRWYALAGGAITEQAALFIHAETLRWALWTPEGLFDHAPHGGQELVGLQVNNGRAQAPEWASFQQAYRVLLAPAAVRAQVAGDSRPAQARLAQLGDLRARIGQLPQLSARGLCAVTAHGCAALRWEAPELPAGASALRIGLLAADRGLGIGPLDVLVNERIVARNENAAGESIVEVPLDPGANRIATRLHAEDRTLFAEGPGIMLSRAGGAEAPAVAGRLVVLAISVSGHAMPGYNLTSATPDAERVAATLSAQAGALFREVRVTVLQDAQATRRGVLDVLAQAGREAAPGDTFVLYMAGHGLRTEPDQRFLFLPHDVTASDGPTLRQQGIEESTLVAAIAGIRARDAILLLDISHAGQPAMDQLSALGNETGRFLLAASTAAQAARAGDDSRNDAFTDAVREALTGHGGADGKGRVSALMLGEWVLRRVPQLAAERGHVQEVVLRAAGRDPRNVPLAVVPP